MKTHFQSVSGISRSVTIATAYIMSCSKLSFQDSFNIIKAARPRSNPSWYFKKQLLNFEKTNVASGQSLIAFNLRQSNDDCEKIQIENLIIETKNDVKLKDGTLKDSNNKQFERAESDDLINEIFQVTSSVLENGLDLKMLK
jgi:hypothetical protein